MPTPLQLEQFEAARKHALNLQRVCSWCDREFEHVDLLINHIQSSHQLVPSTPSSIGLGGI